MPDGFGYSGEGSGGDSRGMVDSSPPSSSYSTGRPGDDGMSQYGATAYQKLTPEQNLAYAKMFQAPAGPNFTYNFNDPGLKEAIYRATAPDVGSSAYNFGIRGAGVTSDQYFSGAAGGGATPEEEATRMNLVRNLIGTAIKGFAPLPLKLAGYVGSKLSGSPNVLSGGISGNNANPTGNVINPSSVTTGSSSGSSPSNLGTLFGAAGLLGLGANLGSSFGANSSFETTGGGGMADTNSFSSFAGDLPSILNIAGGINSLFNQPSAQAAQSSADPFAPYRPGFAATYAGAMAPGGSANIEAMPGYTQYNTGVMQPALQASQRAAAATGQLYSGGEQQALQKTGQQGYYSFMTDYLSKLAAGAGVGQSPYNAAALGNTVSSQNQQGVMQGLGAIGQGFSGLSGMFGNTGVTSYSNYSPSWVAGAAQDMPSLSSGSIDPLLEWSI